MFQCDHFLSSNHVGCQGIIILKTICCRSSESFPFNELICVDRKLIPLWKNKVKVRMANNNQYNFPKITSLKASGFDIHLCWLPGHVGIRGNERADRAAKTAHRTDMQLCLIPPSDFKPIIRKHITTM